jgi:hypothetical protein
MGGTIECHSFSVARTVPIKTGAGVRRDATLSKRREESKEERRFVNMGMEAGAPG